MSTAQEILLKNHGLRVTEQRKEILNAFSKVNQPLPYSDLKNLLPKAFDRITIYRTLKSFEEQGLVHTINDDAGTVFYALCRHDHDHEHDHSRGEHAHFKCSKCQRIECIDHIDGIDTKLPNGYTTESISVLVRGVCSRCKS